MRRHQNEHILQEDESVVNWHGQQNGSQESSEEEITWLDESPSALLVNLEHQCVEGGLGSLDLHNFESLANDEHKECWHDDGESEDDVRSHGGDLSGLSGIVTFNKLHDREESKIEVSKHVVPDVSVKLVLSKFL